MSVCLFFDKGSIRNMVKCHKTTMNISSDKATKDYMDLKINLWISWLMGSQQRLTLTLTTSHWSYIYTQEMYDGAGDNNKLVVYAWAWRGNCCPPKIGRMIDWLMVKHIRIWQDVVIPRWMIAKMSSRCIANMNLICHYSKQHRRHDRDAPTQLGSPFFVNIPGK